MRQLKTSILFFIVFIFSIVQASCMNVATTSAQLVYNRHNIEKNIKDQYLTMQAYQTLYVDNEEFKNSNIVITTYQGEMLLIGQAPQTWQKEKAESLISKIDGIKKLYNRVEVRSPSSYLTRISDTWITAKVKSKLIAANDVDVTQVKVVTENGIVYLMGTLIPEQASVAVDIASNTSGVRHVVKVFSYINISKTPHSVG